jgi:hypothetical protein
MSQKRPFVKGPVVGSETDRLKETVWPESQDWRKRGVLIHTADTTFTTGDWAKNANDINWIDLPSANLPFPLLKRLGLIKWDFIGLFFNAGTSGAPLFTPNAQQIEFELVIDGTPSGYVVSWTEDAGTGAVDFNNRIRFTADLVVSGHPTTGTMYLIECRLLIVSSAGVVILNEITDGYRYLAPTIDGGSDRRLSWRCRKANALPLTSLQIRSVCCYQPVYTSGVPE